jgi:E3 ubiquitin-protein ligase SHPRH
MDRELELQRILEDEPPEAEAVDSPRKKKARLVPDGGAPLARREDPVLEGQGARSNGANEPALGLLDPGLDVHVEALRDAAVARLQKDVEVAEATAHAQHEELKSRLRRMKITADDASCMLGDCVICSKRISDPCLTSCRHVFDFPCLHAWVTQNRHKPSCPTCRAQLKGVKDYPRVSISDLRMLAREVIKLDRDEEDQAAKASSSTASMAAAGASSVSLSLHSQADRPSASSSEARMTLCDDNPHAPGASASGALGLPRADWEDVKWLRIKGEGQIGSKIEACVKYIKYLHTADEGVQVLVFSQFPKVLAMLAQALAVNDISSQQLQGSAEKRAEHIEQFQQPGACTALLMGLRQDNHGLTLVNATAVFLLEPSLNASIEAQAVKRVHRIGQGRECHVYKLLMCDSIEESVDALARSEHAKQAGTNAMRSAASAGEMAPGADALLQSSSKEAMNVRQLLQLMKVEEDALDADAIPWFRAS